MSVPKILRIRFLGGFDLIYKQKSIGGKIPKRLQSLLAYLLLHRHTPQSRQQIAFRLWPDSSDSQARTNLRRNLHSLRQVFPDSEQFIAVDTQSIQWRLESPYTLDVNEFERAVSLFVDQSDELVTRQPEQLKTIGSALQQAVKLYEGKLLPSCYDEWIEAERERLHQSCIQAYAGLLQLLQIQRDHSQVIRYAQQLLQMDPLSETAYEYLMRSHLANGDRTQALQVYHRCMTTLQEELGIDPSQSIQAFYQHLLDEPALLTNHQNAQQDRYVEVHRSASETSTGASSLRCDWGNAPDVSLFYGRADELEMLEQWTLADRCRVIVLLGMGGIGKTSLSVKLAQVLVEHSQLGSDADDKFDCIVWRSLRNAPSLETLMGEIVPIISDQQETEPTLARLMDGLRQTRCLLILDNVETLLKGDQRSGQYHPGYENYGELLRLMGETHHQSCLILTSREKPREFSALEGMDLPVRSLLLNGSPEAAMTLVQTKGLIGTEQQQQDLCQFYGHNPLALKIVATSIQDLFDGDIAAFHRPGAGIFSGIHQLLEQQFQRCTPLEQSVMYWLAINREWTAIAELAEDLVPQTSRSALLEALESLMWRSLLEKQAGRYAQQPVVMEYVTAQLVDQVCHEILTLGQVSETEAEQENLSATALFCTHTLLKAQSSDYIREIQIREILQPVLNGLSGQCGSEANSEPCLRQALAGLHSDPTLQSSYAAGNILNLLSQSSPVLEHYDFSGLALRQADLRRVHLSDCNLQEADLSQAAFIETLSLPLALAFSPDGTRLATGDAKGEIRIWSVEDGRNLLICSGHTDWIWSVAFSPDGGTVASGSSDRTIKLWDLETGQCRQTFDHKAQVWSVAFHPTTPLLASASEDHTVKLWDLETGACHQTLTGHTDWVRSVTFSPNGKTIASGSDDQTIKFWATETGRCEQTLEGHSKRVWSLAYASGNRLASSSSDCTIKFWDTQTGHCIQTLSGHTNWVRSIAFSPDGETLASGSEDRTIRLWQIASGNCRQTLRGHGNWIRSVAFSPDGKTLASGSGDNTVKLWGTNGQCQRTLQGYIDRVWSVAFSPGSAQHPYGGILASANDDHQIKLWNVEGPTYRQTLSGHTDAVCAVRFSPQDHLIASGSEDQTIKLWDLETGQCLRTLKGHTSRIWSVAFSPEGGLLASGSEDQTIKLWDVHTGQCLRTLKGHTNWVCSVAFCPAESLRLVSGGYDQTIKIWDPFTGACCQTLEGHSNWVWSIALSPDGQHLASGSGDHSIKLWNLKTGQCLKTLEGHSSRVWSVAFSPDGQCLASASSDKTVKLWDVRTGGCLQTLEGHTNLAWAVTFSPEGHLLASGSQDETVHLWDRETGECVAVLRGARPYDRTNILHARGLTEAQRMSLKQLGAVEQIKTAAATNAEISNVPIAASQGKPLATLPSTSSLIGRRQEWEMIQGWLGSHLSLLLLGESGIGKTRVLETLRSAVQDMGGQVLWGRGFEAEKVRPFSIWLDALPSQLPAELGTLFPEPGDPELQIDRSRLFDAVAEYLTGLAKQSVPLVIIFDDIQWLDEISTALLNYVVCLLGHSSIQFACAARHRDLEANAAACQLVKTLRRDRKLQVIPLEPLDRQATTELTQTIDADLDSDRIYTDSGGNPLFALEIARTIASGYSADADNLEALVQERLQQLDTSTQDLLTWAAAMGRSFDPMQVAQIADCPLTTFLTAIEELEQQGILSPDIRDDGEAVYLFTHDVVRQVAYGQPSEPRRRLMHRHIAHQLQKLTSSDDALASDIARHAAIGQDPELAATSLLAAAERGLRLFAYTDAAALARWGIEQCQSLPPEVRISLHLRLLKVCVLAGMDKVQAQQVEVSLNQLLLEARRLSLPDEEALGLEVLIALHYEQDNLADVHQQCLKAVEQGRSASPTVMAQMLAYTGWCLSDIGREMERAEALLLEAQSLASRVGLEPFDIPCGLGCVRRYHGDDEQARLLLTQARQIAQYMQDHWREFTCVSYLAMLELESGNAIAALDYCRQLTTVAAQLGGGNEGAVAAALVALSQYWLQPSEAETELEQTLDRLKCVDAQRSLAYTLTSAAEKDLERGEPQRAISRCQMALEAARVVDHPSDVALVLATLIQGYLAIGELELAETHFRDLQKINPLGLAARARVAIANISTQLDAPIHTA